MNLTGYSIHKDIDLDQIWPGTRVMFFDPLLFKNDIDTPLYTTVKPATVISRYGKLKETIGDSVYGPDDDCVDLKFDHRPDLISEGHFTDYVHAIL